MAASNDPSQVSPKLVVGALTGIVIVAVATGLASIGPELLAGLGPWGAPLGSFITALGVGLGVWWKSDPLRANYWANVQADLELQRQKRLDAQGAAPAPENVIEVEEGQPVPYVPPGGLAG